MQCRLDGAAFAACTSPVSFASLPDGPHHLDIRATDTFGNVGTAGRDWLVDNTAPTVTITSGPSGTVNTDDVVLVRRQRVGRLRVPSRRRILRDVRLTPKPYDNLPVGPHTFEVRAVNGAGLTSVVATPQLHGGRRR